MSENTQSENTKRCFIITPIGNPNSDVRRMADGVIESVIRPILENIAFEIETPHSMTDPGSIESAVIQKILDYELVIANLTGLNPNVMYELAVRHSFGKPVVCIAEGQTTLPFDLHSQRVLFYTNDLYGAQELKAKLPDYIRKALDNKSSFNPIINAQSDLEASRRASEPQKNILDKLNIIIERLPSTPTPSDPKNTYRKQRDDGTTTYYICTESEASAYGLIERGYTMVISNTNCG